MIVLLCQWDRRVLVAHAHLHAGCGGVDREVAIAQPAHEVEGLARGLLARHAQRVLRDRRLDR
jgi:hypothetical protein